MVSKRYLQNSCHGPSPHSSHVPPDAPNLHVSLADILTISVIGPSFSVYSQIHLFLFPFATLHGQVYLRKTKTRESESEMDDVTALTRVSQPKSDRPWQSRRPALIPLFSFDSRGMSDRRTGTPYHYSLSLSPVPSLPSLQSCSLF